MSKAWTRIKAWWFWFWAIEMAEGDRPKTRAELRIEGFFACVAANALRRYQHVTKLAPGRGAADESARVNAAIYSVLEEELQGLGMRMSGNAPRLRCYGDDIEPYLKEDGSIGMRVPVDKVEPSGHPSDAELVERAVRNAGYLITDGEVPRWAAVRDTFAVGSSSAFHLCRRFGLDPDAMVGCFVEVEEEDEPTTEAPPADTAFRPGLPPLELRRVHQYWESSFSACVYSFEEGGERFRVIYPGGGDSGLKRVAYNEFKMDMRPHGKSWSEVESLAAAKVAKDKRLERMAARGTCSDAAFDIETGKRATGSEQEEEPAKVAADKQPWEREMERLWTQMFSVGRAPLLSAFDGFAENGEPQVRVGRESYPIEWRYGLDSDERLMFCSLWPIEKLRRVVENWQGSTVAEVPESVARQCFGSAAGPLRTITAFWDADGFALRCGSSAEPARLSPSAMLSALHAAGNEMVTK